MRNFLNQYASLIQWLAGLGVPVAVILSSWLITTSIEQSKIDSEYVRIALSILASDQKQDNSDANKILNSEQEQIALKRWAIRLLNKKSPEKFTEEEQNALLKSKINYSVAFGSILGQLGVQKLKNHVDKESDMNKQ